MDLRQALAKARDEHLTLEDGDETVVGLCFEGEKLQVFDLSFNDEEGPWFAALYSEGLIGSYEGAGEVYGEECLEEIAQKLSSDFPNIGSINFFVCNSGFQEHTMDHILECVFPELPNYDACFPNKTDEYIHLSKALVQARNDREHG